MRKPRHTPLAALILLGFFPGSSFGQTEKKEYQVNTELIALSLHDPVEGLYYLSGDELKKFRSGIVGMGTPMPYKGPNRLRLYREPPLPPTPTPGEEPPPPPRPVADVELPENQGRVFLLLTQREGEPLRIRPFPASFDTVDAGSYRVFNFASTPVRVLLGNESLSLKSLSRGMLVNPAWREDRQDLQAILGTPVEGRMKVVYSRVWGHDPERRYFLFIFDGGHASSPLRIRKVYDRRPPTPDTEEN